MISKIAEQFLNDHFTSEELTPEFNKFQNYYTTFWNYSNFDCKTNNFTAAHFNKIQTSCFQITLCKEETFRKNTHILSNQLKYLSSSYRQVPNPAFQVSWNNLKSQISGLSSYFVYGKMKYLYDILKPYQPANIDGQNIMKFKIPHTFYPMYISLLKNVSKFNQEWKQLKEYILTDIEYFTHKQPYGTRIKFYDCESKDYISLCKDWLEWFLPNNLYEFAIFLDTNRIKLNDNYYNFSLLVNDICHTNYFKTIILQNEFFELLIKEFKPNSSPSLYTPKSYSFYNKPILYKSEYNIFLSLSETFYLWEDNLYQTYLKSDKAISS